MKLEDLIIQIKNKNSFLCIGLDTDINKIPKFLLNEDDPIFSFNKSIIDYNILRIGQRIRDIVTDSENNVYILFLENPSRIATLRQL